MPKLVKFEQLQAITNALWDKSKEKFANLDLENTFKEDNNFEKDIFLLDDNMYVGEELSSPNNASGGTKKIGRRDYTSHSHGNSGYVKSLIVKLRGNAGLSEGNTINMSVWSVKKRDNNVQEGDDVQELFTDKASKVVNYGSWGLCIEIPIDKTFDEPVYFVFKTPNNQTNKLVHKQMTASPNYIYLGDSDNVTVDSLNGHMNNPHAIQFGIVGGIDVKKALKGLKLENGKLPVSLLPDISINEFHVVATQEEAKQLANNGTIQKGDVVVVEGNDNSLHMWNGQTQGEFHEMFIELDVSTGVVKQVNGKRPEADGSITIGIEDIATLQDTLNNKIEDWNGLEYTGKKTFTNLLSGAVHSENKIYSSTNGSLVDSQGKSSYKIDNLEAGAEYFLVSKDRDVIESSCMQVFPGGGFAHSDGAWRGYNWVYQNQNKFGYYVFKLRRASSGGVQATSATIQYNSSDPNVEKKFMVYKGGLEPQSEHIQSTETYYEIDGDKVETKFYKLDGIQGENKTLKEVLETLASRPSGGTSGVTSINGQRDVINLSFETINQELKMKINNEQVKVIDVAQESDIASIINQMLQQ